MRIGRRGGACSIGVCLALLALLISVLVAASGKARRASAATGVLFGFNTQLSPPGGGPGTGDNVGRAISDINSGSIVRFPLEWAPEQTCKDALGGLTNSRLTCVTPQPYNWGPVDSLLDPMKTYLQAGQVKLLPSITNAPGWAWGLQDSPDAATKVNGHHPIMPPGDDSTALGWWKQFIYNLVLHIEGRYATPTVKPFAGIEIWNEENFWPYGWSTDFGPRPDPVRFTRVLCNAFGGNYMADPSVPVVFGGIAGPDSGATGNWSGQSDFLNKAYGAFSAGTGPDIRKCMNAMGIHPYNSANSGSTWAAPNTANWEFLVGPQLFGQIVCQHGDCGRPIWITEFGYPITNPPSSTDQSNWDLQAYNMAAGTPTPWPAATVSTIIIHSLFDPPSGVCASPGNPNPAATAFKDLFSGTSQQASC